MRIPSPRARVTISGCPLSSFTMAQAIRSAFEAYEHHVGVVKIRKVGPSRWMLSTYRGYADSLHAFAFGYLAAIAPEVKA